MQAILVHNVEGEDLEALNFSKAYMYMGSPNGSPRLIIALAMCLHRRGEDFKILKCACFLVVICMRPREPLRNACNEFIPFPLVQFNLAW